MRKKSTATKNQLQQSEEAAIKFVSPPEVETTTIISQALDLSGSDINLIFLAFGLLLFLDWRTEGETVANGRRPMKSKRRLLASKMRDAEFPEEDILILDQPIKSNAKLSETRLEAMLAPAVSRQR